MLPAALFSHHCDRSYTGNCVVKFLLRDRLVDGLAQVCNEVIFVFDTDRKPDERVSDAEFGTRLRGHRCVGHDGRELGERLVAEQAG